MGRLLGIADGSAAGSAQTSYHPAFGTSVSVPLLAGDRGTEQTVELIRKAVHDGLSNPTVRATAARALAGVAPFNDQAAIQAIYNWVLRNIRFTNDPVGHETISSAEWTIRNGIGDCDDINAVLLPTLLMVVGYPVELVTVNDDPTDPAGEFTHVYSQVMLNGRVIPLDAARPGASFGTTISRAFRKRVWSLTSNEYQDLAGIRRGLNGPSARAHRYGGDRGMRGDGCGLGFDWSALANIFSSAATATGNIISSINIPKFQAPPANAAGGYGTAAYGPGAASSLGGINPVLLLGGFGLLALVLMGKK